LTSDSGERTTQDGAVATQGAGKRMSLALRALRFLALCLYLLIFAEVYLRVLAPQAIIPRYVTGAPWGVRGNIPNAQYWHYTPEVSVEYRINSQGMRADREFPLAKPAGTCRIAVLGDSFFVGYELDLRDTFTTRLEERLRAAGFQAEVLNFSVSGFGTAEMVRTYEGFARRFDPDIVLFEWHYTDPDDNVRAGLYRLDGARVQPANDTYLPGVRIQDALLRSSLYRLIADHSHLYAFARERIAISLKDLLVKVRARLSDTVAEEAPTAPPPASEPGAQPKDDLRTRLAAGLMLHAQELIQREGRDYYVVEVPRRVSRTEFKPSIDVLPADVRARLQIISPLSALKAAAHPDTKLYYEEGHGHFTPAGVELLVRETQQVIQRSPRLGACATSATSR
jgi:hypothetical protein